MLLKLRMLGTHQDLLRICVDMKEEDDETVVQTQEASQEKGSMIWSEQSVFGAWVLSNKVV